VELIVVDDGSTDDTAELIKNRFPQVKFIQQKNSGVSAARNTGIKNALGQWIAFLDSDDEWLPQKLKYQMKQLEQYPDYKICHSDEIWIKNGRFINPKNKHKKFGGWIFDKCLPLCAISPSTVLIHRQIFTAVGLFDETLPACEDYDLWLRITARYPVLYSEDKLINKYGGHPDQLSARYWGMDRYRIYSLHKIISSGALNTADKQLAIEILQKKVSIYLIGARKRGKKEEVEYYQQLLASLKETLS